MISGLLSLQKLLTEACGLFFEVTDLEFVSKLDFIVPLFECLELTCESLSVFIILLLLEFSLVHELLLHLVDFDLGLFLADDRLTVGTLKTLEH